MSKSYLLYLSSSSSSRPISAQQSRLLLNQHATHMQVGDRILLVQDQKEKNILPVVYIVEALNRGTGALTLKRDKIYNQTVKLADIATIPSLQRNSIQNSTQQLSDNDLTFVIETMMGGSRMEERSLLDTIAAYITDRGYYFERETLDNYHICLKTRPFAILAGLSGTGKSKLSQLYAEALGHKKHYLRLPVSPNWYSDQALLGYFDTISGQYITEQAADFILKANQDTDNLYFICLDEMNLAHVEHYFAQFLSAMEEEDPEERTVRLMADNVYQRLEEKASLQPKLQLPTNLFFTGTINVDETTKSISDKVIDRANTLEFFSVDLEKAPLPAEIPPSPLNISAYTWQSYVSTRRDTTFRPQLSEISKILNRADMGLGFRILHDIERYLANSQELLEPGVAFDLQVKQRILPRVRGTETIKKNIDELHAFARNNGLSRTENRLDAMKYRLQRDGYTSFWR
ncbi:McrB family protein [Dictyobacter arantiisoli]|uniref:ATPase dynein-related AAA domain-containing protein n=1 Tax=Dictyobacter arantiisoli TaxID=2014874 RepID=A0A5A5TC39_9CHLR|nr:AAA family ATPase [Dictyobacter arantiisoli]GCF08504.1 hypothetical protein KDI_20680 [Dictyobacter arantiisoli]